MFGVGWLDPMPNTCPMYIYIYISFYIHKLFANASWLKCAAASAASHIGMAAEPAAAAAASSSGDKGEGKGKHDGSYVTGYAHKIYLQTPDGDGRIKLPEQEEVWQALQVWPQVRQPRKGMWKELAKEGRDPRKVSILSMSGNAANFNAAQTMVVDIIARHGVGGAARPKAEQEQLRVSQKAQAQERRQERQDQHELMQEGRRLQAFPQCVWHGLACPHAKHTYIYMCI